VSEQEGDDTCGGGMCACMHVHEAIWIMILTCDMTHLCMSIFVYEYVLLYYRMSMYCIVSCIIDMQKCTNMRMWCTVYYIVDYSRESV